MSNRVLLGILLVLLGIAFILNDYFGIFSGFSAWWPILVILIGVIQIVRRSASLVTSLAIIAAGAVFLVRNLGLIPGEIVFPIILILAGCWFIFSRLTGNHKNTGEDRLNHFVMFTGLKTKNHARNFTGGSVAAVFGGADIDLRDAQLSEQGAELELTVVFGGIDVFIPEDWRMQVTGTPLFGGWEDKTHYVRKDGADGPVLKIHCLALFGGAEVKN
mgnify:FL=1